MKKIIRKTPVLIAATVAASLLQVNDAVAQDAGENSTADADAAAELNLTPKRYKLDRYTSIWSERSPFEIIADEPDEAPPEDPPFEDYSLAGYSKRGNVWRVTVVNVKDPKEKHHLQSGKVSDDGFELLNFKPDRNYRKSEVTVRRSGKSGNIGFNEKRLKPATGVKGTPGITKAPTTRKPNSKQQPGRTTSGRSGQPGRSVNNQNATTNAAKNAAAGGQKSDAAAQIRQMLQNRANASKTTNTGGKKPQPRRRVILPPSR